MLGLVVTALMSTGCATIMHGDKQNVSIVSGKPEATIKEFLDYYRGADGGDTAIFSFTERKPDS